MEKQISLSLIIRNLLWAALVPGTVTVYLPYLIVTRWHPQALTQWSVAQLLGLTMIAVGAVILLYCIWQFAITGHGTLSPLDAPSRLVVEGLYRYVRNPMYLGVMLILLGESLLFRSIILALYAAGWFVMFNLVIVLYEEPALRKRFGGAYVRYCSEAGRWLP